MCVQAEKLMLEAADNKEVRNHVERRIIKFPFNNKLIQRRSAVRGLGAVSH